MTVVVSLTLALGLGAACVALLQRQRDLEERIARLEKRSPLIPRATTPAAPEAAPMERAPLPVAAPVETRRSEAAAPVEAVTPAVQDAVAREVERQLKERGGGLVVHPMTLEDPLTVMEKELGLTPAQKVRVAELWKRRDEELMKVIEGGPDGEGFREHAKKLQEVETRYDTEIKRELDFAQAQKYDELRKQGKLMGGNVVIQLNVEEKAGEKK